jgi:hypothetical protein
MLHKVLNAVWCQNHAQRKKKKKNLVLLNLVAHKIANVLRDETLNNTFITLQCKSHLSMRCLTISVGVRSKGRPKESGGNEALHELMS